MRFFNTAGPVNCQMHYCLPPLERFDLKEILLLLAQHEYFVLHAPRQVGKTSFLLALMEHLNKQEQYTCLYINVEIAQTARENVDEGIRSILGELASQAQIHLGDDYLESIWWETWQKRGGGIALGKVLSSWAKHNSKPIVLLIDEILNFGSSEYVSNISSLN